MIIIHINNFRQNIINHETRDEIDIQYHQFIRHEWCKF